MQRGARDVLDALHQLDEEVMPIGPDGGESDATVAHDDGRDAVPARRRDLGIPRDLAVVVRVDVDPTRRERRGHRRRACDVPLRPTRPTSVMRPSLTVTSPTVGGAPVPSTIVAPRITRSCMTHPLPPFGALSNEARLPRAPCRARHPSAEPCPDPPLPSELRKHSQGPQ